MQLKLYQHLNRLKRRNDDFVGGERVLQRGALQLQLDVRGEGVLDDQEGGVGLMGTDVVEVYRGRGHLKHVYY